MVFLVDSSRFKYARSFGAATPRRLFCLAAE